jgi:hypothetical protein
MRRVYLGGIDETARGVMNNGKPHKIRPPDPARPARRESSEERKQRRQREREQWDETTPETSVGSPMPPASDKEDSMLDGAGVESAAGSDVGMEQAESPLSADVEQSGTAASMGIEQAGGSPPVEVDPGAEGKQEI